MKALRDIRWNLQKDKNTPRTRYNGQKHASALQPPKQVIRAKADYTSTSPCELSFRKGDFFHVVPDDAAPQVPGWFNACNPLTNARGVVPAKYFDVLQRSSPSSAVNLQFRSELNPNGTPGEHPQPIKPRATPTGSTRTFSGVYATVKYDFTAELPQELSVKAGESIVILAHSNHEWFVAKSLVRIGKSGLVPASFVDAYDPKTGALISTEGYSPNGDFVPSLSEWQSTNERFQQNTIALGRIPSSPRISDSSGLSSSSMGDRTVPMKKMAESPTQISSAAMSTRSNSNDSFLPSGLLTSASVISIHVESNDIWYRIRAVYVLPLFLENMSEFDHTHESRELVLLRMYDDLNEFHIALMNKMPSELGLSRRDIAPLIPGFPSRAEINDETSLALHRVEMDHYLRTLCIVPEAILRSAYVRSFFEPRYGDSCTTSYPRAVSASLSTGLVECENSVLGSSFSFANSTPSWCSSQVQCSYDQEVARHLSGRRTGSVGGDSYIEGSVRRLNESYRYPYPQEQLLRVKVAKRSSPEMLVALRVVPSECSYTNLLARVQAKLGSDIRQLYVANDVMTQSTNDDELKSLLQASLTTGKKLFLYADSA